MAETEKTLYQLLGVAPSASKAEIRKAYHRLALACHPDKHPDDDTAKERFQTLQRIKVHPQPAGPRCMRAARFLTPSAMPRNASLTTKGARFMTHRA